MRVREREERRGQLLGVRQSGLSDLKFARLTRDRELIATARAWAQQLVDAEDSVVEPLRREAERLDENRRGFA